jgi:hypothetical protein
LAHPGQEPRPQASYFYFPGVYRNVEMSQGDIYQGVPIWLPPSDAMDPWDVTAGEVIVLTPSCMIDKQNVDDRLILVAPVVPLDEREWEPSDIAILSDNDCVHAYMYLPAEGPWPARVVEFLRAQPIRYSLLDRCQRQSQLSYTAYQQLMRKLGIFFSLGHTSAADYEPNLEDFPDGID